MPTRIEDVPAELIVDYDVHDPALAETIHERLAEIRERMPLAYSTAHGGYWLVTRYEDVYEIARQPEIYSNFPVGIPAEGRPDKYIPLEIDPPDHTEWRHMLGPLFNPVRMNALEDDIRQLAGGFIDRFIADGQTDFMSSFAHPLPTTLFLRLMGWPEEDEPKLSHWTTVVLSGVKGGTPEESHAARTQAGGEVAMYFFELIAKRRAEPTDDFTSFLLSAKFRGRDLTENEIFHILFILMLGGLHTVRGALGFAMIELVNNPDQRDRLVDDPSLIPGFVEEVLRIEATVSPGRTVTQPVVLHGIELQPGDRVLLSVPSANRDPREFPDPDSVQLDRSDNRHLGFSAGPHRCIGSHLARIELRVALEELLKRIPDFKVAGAPGKHHGQVRGIEELLIKFTPGQ